MKNQKNYGIYDFSDYAEEVTGEALFKINGGEQVENSNKGVAGAKPGDTVTRNDGTTVTIGEADIKYAQQQLGINGNTPTGSNNAQNPGSGAPSGYNPGGGADDSKKETSNITNSYIIDEENKTISVNINNLQSLQDAYNAYYILGSKGYSFVLTEGSNVVHTFTEEKYVKQYVQNQIKPDSTFFEKYISYIATYILKSNLFKTIEMANANTQIAGATVDFINQYNIMKSENIIGNDHYNHALANSKAAQRGVYGKMTAQVLSYFREATDVIRKNDTDKDIREDNIANRYGRNIPAGCSPEEYNSIFDTRRGGHRADLTGIASDETPKNLYDFNKSFFARDSYE